MKVLGNNSLSSKVLIGLKFVVIVTVIAMIFIASVLIKNIRDVALYGNQKLEETIIISGVFIAGFVFIAMLMKLIKFFKNLKYSKCFEEENTKLLKDISMLILTGSIIYCLIEILQIIFSDNYISIIVYNSFLWILTVIMFCLSVGMKIFIEIYKKAIEFKKENDFTI